eukprot:4029702-Lingulodinium_polyedra.AAC.1
MARVADGVDSRARTRVLHEGRLSLDAAGAFRAVVAGVRGLRANRAPMDRWPHPAPPLRALRRGRRAPFLAAPAMGH